MLATPEAPRTITPQYVACDGEAIERLEAHVAFLGRELATIRDQIRVMEDMLSRQDSAIGGLSALGRAARIDSAGDLVLSGINLRLINDETAYGEANGKGNILLGHGTGADQVLGSHNLVIGPRHTVTGRSGLVVGSGHTTAGSHSVVIGGTNSEAGHSGAVIGSLYSGALGTPSVVIGGRDLWAHGSRNVLVGGHNNDVDGNDLVVIDNEPYGTE